jgi:hypothetical protein
MQVGNRLLELVRGTGARRVFVVGTAKNVGKTVTMRALAEAAAHAGLRIGMTSTGRDGEAVDASGEHKKPRLFLPPGALIATARSLLPSHPGCEIVDLTDWRTPGGSVLFARVRRSGYFELAGPSTASGVQQCLKRFVEMGCDLAIVDGALDRVAALSGGAEAIVVAAGAASAPTMEKAVEDVSALVRRLRIPAYEPAAPNVRLSGALTPALAADFLARGERRQIVVRDATQIAASGKGFTGIAERLDLRCERPFDVVAASIASIAPDRYFEPHAFAHAVAGATGLPVFDVYAATETRAA